MHNWAAPGVGGTKTSRRCLVAFFFPFASRLVLLPSRKSTLPRLVSAATSADHIRFLSVVCSRPDLVVLQTVNPPPKRPLPPRTVELQLIVVYLD